MELRMQPLTEQGDTVREQVLFPERFQTAWRLCEPAARAARRSPHCSTTFLHTGLRALCSSSAHVSPISLQPFLTPRRTSIKNERTILP